MKESDKNSDHIKNKHTDDLIDHYWGSINYVSGLIKASEIKAGLILSFYGILLNFTYNYLEMVLTEASNKPFLYSIVECICPFSYHSSLTPCCNPYFQILL